MQGQHPSSVEPDLLEWLATFSPAHAAELRRRAIADDNSEARGHAKWLRSIANIPGLPSRDFCQEPRTTDGRGFAGSGARRQGESLREGEWDPAKHPRLGGPPNAGWFARVAGLGIGVATGASPSPSNTSNVSAPTPPKSGGASTGTTSSPDPSSSSPKTKTHLPADRRGSWIEGTKGDGTFRYNDIPENKEVGIAGKEIRFKNQYIAVGGFPRESYFGGDPDLAAVEIDRVTGTKSDGRKSDKAMRNKLKDPNWKRPSGYRWNHAGEPGSKVMELVDTSVHSKMAHKGAGSEARAIGRQARGRAIGALTVYMAVRDTLQMSGALKPDYEEWNRLIYHFRDENGSEFFLHEPSWIRSAKREFVTGPRKGEREVISREDFEEYKKRAEAEFGKYIPGSLFSEPRFIPGRQRKKIHIYFLDGNGTVEEGHIDENGVHRYGLSHKVAI